MLFFIGRALDAAQIEDSISATKTKVRSYRDNVNQYHFIVYKKAVEVAEGLDIQPVAPRVTSMAQILRSITEEP